MYIPWNTANPIERCYGSETCYVQQITYTLSKQLTKILEACM